MTNSIIEWTKKRPTEPGIYLLREGNGLYYLVLDFDEFGELGVDYGSSPGAKAAFAYAMVTQYFGKIELSE
jgi:hypothetical protein